MNYLISKDRSSIRPIRLLIIFGNLGIGGVQRKILDIVDNIQKNIHEPILIDIVLRDKPTFRYDSFISSSAANIHYRPNRKIGFLHMPFTLYVWWMIFSLRPDRILTFYATLSSTVIFAKLIFFWRTFKVIINEDIFPSAHNSAFVLRLLVNIFYPFADRIILPTISAQIDLLSCFSVPKEKTIVAPNWTLLDANRRSKSKKYDLLYIGRFEPQKNIMHLLDCMRVLASQNHKLRACIAGEGSLKQDIINFIESCSLQKNIHVQKSSHNVVTLFKESRIFTLCSLYEGMSVAVLEAMYFGLPIVVTPHPGADEYIQQGINGFVTESQEEYVDTIITILDHKTFAKKLGKNAKLTIKNKFSKSAFQHYVSSMIYVETHE